MSLAEQLQTIDGIGEAKAAKIIELIEEDSNQWLEKAYSELEKGNEQRALTFLKRSQ